MLILPGSPEFDLTLATAIPPGWRQVAEAVGAQVAFVAEAGSGLLRPASAAELDEYLLGGEYDERLQDIEDGEEGDELVAFS